MLRVALKILLAGAALAAVWCFVPIGGQTMASRWRRAGNPEEFVERAWAEIRGEPLRAARGRTDPSPRSRNASPRARPSESYSTADRRELDRILSRRLDDP